MFKPVKLTYKNYSSRGLYFKETEKLALHADLTDHLN